MNVNYIGIDPSTKTGIVILDNDGNVLLEEEITGTGDKDPKRMVTLTNKIINQIKGQNSTICIEGFSYGSKGRGISFQFGLGHAIRNEMFKHDIKYINVSPGQLKKFATGKGNTSKDNMILPIYKRWGYEHDSDNVRDAFVLAQIAKGLSYGNRLVKHQREVIFELKKQTIKGV